MVGPAGVSFGMPPKQQYGAESTGNAGTNPGDGGGATVTNNGSTYNGADGSDGAILITWP